MSIIRYTTPQITSWPRFNRASSLRDLFDSAFQLTDRASGYTERWVPALDVFEDQEKVSVQIELPGLKKEDFDISLDGDVLTISGERKVESEKQEGGNFRRERAVGSFRRSITLPSQVKGDQVKATYEDGVLTVALPKADEAKPRKIQVELN